MDYLIEAISLGIDLVILAACAKQYYKNKNAITMIQVAPYLTINKELTDIVTAHPEQKLPYIAIRGTVKALGKPITSNNNPTVCGVVQLLSTKVHTVQRSTAGFWADREHTVQEVYNFMPFVLLNNKMQIEIADPLAADILDLDVISDKFNPTSPSIMDHIWGFFAGINQRGVQSTEKMLREGTMLTAIGELILTKDDVNNTKTLKLQPPTNGAPFYLTNMNITSLLKKLDTTKRNYKILCLLFGTISIVISGLIIRKYWKYKDQLIEDRKRNNLIEKLKSERRRRMRDQNLTDNQLCVVCKTNPIEMILLPCGHVCLCIDCSIDISNKCPVCRADIQQKTAAYVV